MNLIFNRKLQQIRKVIFIENKNVSIPTVLELIKYNLHLLKAYDFVFPCIQRRDDVGKQNVDFIENLLASSKSDASEYSTLSQSRFDSETSKAVRKILSTLDI